MTVAEVFSADALAELSSPASFVRGMFYHSDGRVEQTTQSGGRVRSTVRGSMPYAVELWVDDGEPHWSCTCPAGESGTLCKHCVAVALSATGVDPDSAFDPEPPTTVAATADAELAAYVAGLDRDRLVDLVVAQAAADWRLRERLTAEADAAAGTGPSITAWQQRIDAAFAPYDDFVDWREAAGWASEIDDLIDALEEQCDAGHTDAVVVLTEYAHRCADDSVEHVDDSGGELGGISTRLSELHLRACAEGRPDPVGLARRLVDLELTSELDGFHRAAATYADVLGVDGLAEYRRLVQPAWDRLHDDTAELTGSPGLTDDDADLDDDAVGDVGEPSEFAVRHAMIGWALGTGDPDELIAVRSRDLRLPDDYLEIGRALTRADRTGEAIEWARRGLVEQSSRTWQLDPLREFLASLLRSTGDVEGAVELFWQAFVAVPSVTSYRRLLDEAPGDRDRWSQRCLDLLRTSVGGDGHGPPGRRPRSSTPLIEILLFEGDVDEAWEVAAEHGCDSRLKMTLARAREATHPLDAVEVYQPEVFALIERKNNQGYASAVDLMERIRKLSATAGEPERFDAVLHRARTEHRAKRNLKAMLNQRGWSQ